ncbi:MAG: response regulator, partial [Acidobacteriales bacterium]|nr:response regulator [Terriglobales bacterium]
MVIQKEMSILLVDDDDNDALLLRRAFSQTHCAIRFLALNSGQAALDYFQGAGHYADRDLYPVPQLVILDSLLPRIPGQQILEMIKSDDNLKVIPVIILTGAISPENIVRLYRLGANAICLKPSSVHALQAFAESVCAFWIQSAVSCDL